MAIFRVRKVLKLYKSRNIEREARAVRVGDRGKLGVWGRSPQRGAGAEPLLIGVGDGRVVCVVCCGVVLCGVVCACALM